MTIDLNNHELEMLDAALVAWAKQPQDEAFGGALMGTFLGAITRREGEAPDKDEDSAPKKMLATASAESKKRERQALLLRAKLAQGMAVNSEHEC